jgi:hypothetical protein
MDFEKIDIQLEKEISNEENILQGKFLPKIYVYTEPQYENAQWTHSPNKNGKGFLKVGDTKKTTYQRVKEQFATNKPTKNPFSILLEEVALRDDDKTFFRDYDVHKVLENSGFYRFPKSEWFECTIDDVKKAINAVKTHKTIVSDRINNFKMREEQEYAVNMTSEYFTKYSKENENGKPPHFLWNAKMRFGKTFTTYQLAIKMGWTKILILTFKPAVETSWKQDLLSHVDFEGWQFISKNEVEEDDIDTSKPYVRFASFQDVLQKTELGGIKTHNTDIHLTNWDCIVLDEYHFGAWNKNSKDLYDAKNDAEIINTINETKELNEMNKEKGEKTIDYYDEELMPLTTNAYLYLSGTPFRALNNGEFLEDQIFNWTYSDEQKAKKEWDYSKGENPYAELPQMVMMTYKMPEEIRNIAKDGEFNEFSLNEFFSASEVNGHFKFKHEAEVVNWLNLMRGQYKPTAINELKTGFKPPMPYSDIRLISALSHTFWFLPNVASCKAMGELLEKHPFYNEYKINVCAGNEAGMGADALIPVRESIGNGYNTKTITLSCGKLATGVTVPEWSGIFMLKDTASPETYFQAAFRVQSPWIIKNPDGLNPNEKFIVKEKCYLFDFSLDRALKQVAEYSSKLNVKNEQKPEEKVAEFINFLPVICYDGSRMDEISAEDIMNIIVSGTGASMLARRWGSAMLVNVDDITLSKLLNDEKALTALEKIESFRNLNKELSAIVNKSEEIKKVKKEKKESLSNEEKKKLTEEEKEMKSKRQHIKEQLLQFAKRVPIFMYLTDDREQTLLDVILQLESDLFTKVTNLTLEDFNRLVEIGIFNESTMNDAVFAFKRFEDASLIYLDNETNQDEIIGGWNTKISREEYTNLE